MKASQILDTLDVGFFSLGSDYRVRFWNRWLELNTSVDRARIMGKNIFEFFPYLDNTHFTRKVDSILSFGNYAYYSQKIHQFLLKIRNPAPDSNGFEFMQQNCSMGPIRDMDGTIESVFVTVTDVTDIAGMEVELRKTAAQMRSIIDDQTELICRFAPDGIITFANDSFCRYLSRSKDDILGTPAFAFIYKGDWRRTTRLLKSLSPLSPIVNVEFRVAIPDTGEIRWQNWTSKAFFNASGELMECQAVGRDITQQRLADDELKRNREGLERKIQERAGELRKSEEMYRGLFNASRDGLAIVDKNGLIVDINPAFCEMTGFNKSESVDMSFRNIVPDKWWELEDEIVNNEVLVQGYSSVYDLELKRKDKHVFPASVRSYAISDIHGSVMHNIRDITERKLAEKERVALLREMEEKAKHNRCLYLVAVSIKMSETAEELFRDVVTILPENFRHSKISCVRIMFDEKEYASENFRQTDYSTKSMLTLDGVERGFIEACYLEKTELLSDGPFTVSEGEMLEAIAFNISEALENLRDQDALMDYHERLQALAIELEEVQEQERTRIANELHDQIGQKLAFLRMELARLRGLNTNRDHTEFERSSSLIEDIIHDSRTLMLEISPSALFQLGFLDSIEWLAEQFDKNHGIKVNIVADIDCDKIDESHYMPLFKAVRESLNNIVKHAGVSEAEIRIFSNRTGIIIEINDRGAGFIPSSSTNAPPGRLSFGLFNMTQSMAHIKCHAEIESVIGQGTTVRIKIPVMRENIKA